ncbi:sulfatase [Bacteroidota bacterium]
MKKISSLLIILSLLVASCADNKPNDPPNILFIIADDISRTSMGAYGCEFLETPNFDRIAEEGVLFTNAYVCNPKCAPARATLLTGRYSWQLEEACNHWPAMPEKWVFYPDLLEAAGYDMGFTGKGWGPGTFPGEHNPAGWEYNDLKNKKPYKFMNAKDYIGNFKVFLDGKDEEKPFCFWFGTHEAHRAFQRDVHLLEGIDPNKIDVQGFFPDNDLVRRDIADYGMEVEYHDQMIGECLEILEKRGMLDNTLIVVTSDHGMAFPRIKGQIYDEGFHVAFAARWSGKIKPGRVVDDFINFPDVAPTFMEVAGLEAHEQMTGKSFLNLLLSEKSGQLTKDRDHSLLGKERHDIGRTDGDQLTVGYPVRAIRTAQYLYARNYKTNRWPAGDPEYGYPNCDASPTMSYLLQQTPDSADYEYYEMAFGKRVEEELFDIILDPDCLNNLAEDPEYAGIKEELRSKMEEELTNQGDPRVLGNGDIFDYYPHGNLKKLESFYGNKYVDMHQIYNDKYTQ